MSMFGGFLESGVEGWRTRMLVWLLSVHVLLMLHLAGII